tara:strand:- start:57 stop:158 length:102 start_codon:yes stop_codon:yes gene_type:complete
MKSSFEFNLNLDEQILKRIDKQMINELVNENVK